MSHRPIQAICVATMTLAVTALSVTAPADAGRRHRDRVDRNYVVAESEFGNGRVSGPVRWTSKGRQVRLPGGSWVWCEQSCSETLRVKTVDFWESEEGAGSRHAITNQGGIFGKLRIERRF